MRPDRGLSSSGGVPTRPIVSSDRERAVLLTVLAACLAAGLAVVLTLLGYHYQQAPHRLFKIVLAGAFLTLLLWKPTWLPALLCFAIPYGDWLPKAPVPLLNAVNLLSIGSLLGIAILTLEGRAHPLVRSPLNLPWAAFATWMVFSWIHGAFLWPERTATGWWALRHLWSVLSGFLVFLILTHLILDRAALWRTIGLFTIACAAATIGPAVEGLRDGFLVRTPGGVGDVNRMGALLAMGSVFAFGIAPAYRGAKGVGAYLAWLVSALALFLPNSRGAYAGFLAGLLPPALRRSLLTTLGLVALIASSALWAPQHVRDRVRATWEAAGAEDREAALDSDSGGRLTVWRQIVEGVGRNPVIGVGYGNLVQATGLTSGNYKNAHNLYLEVAGEMGLVGLVLLLWLLWRCWSLGRLLLRRGGRSRVLGQAYQAMLICFLVSNIFGQRFFDYSLSGFFFAASGFVVLEERFTREEERSGDTT